MAGRRSLLLVTLLGIPLLAQSQPQASGDSAPENAVTVTLTERSVTEKTFRLGYQIHNGYDADIWICTSLEDPRDPDFEVSTGQDGATLVVQRRNVAPVINTGGWVRRRYVRLRRGEARSETISLSLPVYFGMESFDSARSLPPEHAGRFALAMGYCEGDLPARVSRVYGKRERVWDEEIVISQGDWALKGEKTLWMTVDDVNVPYHKQYLRPARIHLSPLKRIEVHFRRSPLEFFFPYAQQQALLTPKEKQYLQSLKDFTLEDKWDLMGIAYDASEAADGAFFTERGVVDLKCHRKDGSVVSLTAYDHGCIVTDEGRVFRCLEDLTRLRMLTPQVRSLDLRVQCAANLKGLWYRFREYHPGQSPPADRWCDAIRAGEFACPSVAEGKCHYAMNPQCRHDSPGDVVLLFETKAGWDQHGGPELFSFTNHDPRGGCVLLNDGTVKFIRTQAKLTSLRWK